MLQGQTKADQMPTMAGLEEKQDSSRLSLQLVVAGGVPEESGPQSPMPTVATS